MKKNFLIFGSFSGALAVALGALGAHFLKQKLSEGVIAESSLQSFETAVKYQMYHSIMLLIIALWYNINKDKKLLKAGNCFIVGIILFSGSIYLLATSSLTGINFKILGPITPLGGLFFIAGWLLLGFHSLSKNNHQANV